MKHEQIDSVLIPSYLPFFQSFGYHDGFTGIGTNLGSLFQSQDGTIYVGTNDRLHPTFKIENLVKVTKLLRFIYQVLSYLGRQLPAGDPCK